MKNLAKILFLTTFMMLPAACSRNIQKTPKYPPPIPIELNLMEMEVDHLSNKEKIHLAAKTLEKRIRATLAEYGIEDGEMYQIIAGIDPNITIHKKDGSTIIIQYLDKDNDREYDGIKIGTRSSIEIPKGIPPPVPLEELKTPKPKRKPRDYKKFSQY